MNKKISATHLISQMPIGDLEKLNISDIYKLWKNINHEIDLAKNAQSLMEFAINQKYGKLLNNQRVLSSKDSGMVSIEDEGFILRHNLMVKPEWDQCKLKQIISKLCDRGVYVSSFINANYYISERQYHSMHTDMRSIFAKARFLKTVGSSYKISKIDSASNIKNKKRG